MQKYKIYFMEAILVILLLAILVLLIIFGSNIAGKISQLSKEMRDANQRMQMQSKEMADLRFSIFKLLETKTDSKTEKVIEIPKEKEKDKEIIPEKIVEKEIPVEKIEIPVKDEIKIENKTVEKQVSQQNISQQQTIYIPKPPKPKANWEKFIGENLINKIGIAVLVLGLGFFVKYAIDQNWISEFGRVAIGILCAGALIGIGHFLRKSFRAFSSVLVGGGIAVLYFTIAIAFQEYKIFDQVIAFAIMVVITLFSIVLSIGYDRKELAILSLLGGFATPFMVSTGEGNYVVLFTYLTILNVGMFILAYFKKWNVINVIAQISTTIIFSAWILNEFFDSNKNHYEGGLIFATIFYFVFFGMHIINNIKSALKFSAFEVMLLLGNTLFYYSIGMVLIHKINPEMKGVFTVSIGIFNFFFAYLFYKKTFIDKTLVYLLIALVLTFASLTAPVQLKGNYITMFWAAEAVILLFLFQKSGIKMMKISSIIVMFLMIGSLIWDWKKVYFTYNPFGETLPIATNNAFITSLTVIISWILYYFLSNKNSQETETKTEWKNILNNFIKFTVVAILFLAFFFEIYYQLHKRLPIENARVTILGMYHFLFLTAVLVWTRWKNVKYLFETFTLIGLIMSFYLIYYQRVYMNLRDDFVLGNVQNSFLPYHYLMVACALFSVHFLWKNIQLWSGEKSIWSHLTLWWSGIIWVWNLSLELQHIFVFTQYREGLLISEIEKQALRIGFPILWGICSFAWIIFGMKLKSSMLRIMGLTLFCITLLKLFIFDLRDISEGGKVAAFISLGILLLIISFMYQKLKRLIFEETNEKTE